MSLLTAFINGKRVNPRFMPWNQTEPIIRMNKATYDDLSSDVLFAVLRSLPKQEDEKARMTTADLIRNEVMAVVGERLS